MTEVGCYSSVQLAKFLIGTCDPSERSAIQAHLAACELCQSTVAEIDQSSTVMRIDAIGGSPADSSAPRSDSGQRMGDSRGELAVTEIYGDEQEMKATGDLDGALAGAQAGLVIGGGARSAVDLSLWQLAKTPRPKIDAGHLNRAQYDQLRQVSDDLGQKFGIAGGFAETATGQARRSIPVLQRYLPSWRRGGASKLGDIDLYFPPGTPDNAKISVRDRVRDILGDKEFDLDGYGPKNGYTSDESLHGAGAILFTPGKTPESFRSSWQ